MTNETQDWLTLWQTELAGMAADPDWSARTARLIEAARAFGAWAHDPTPSRPPAADVASVAERFAALERRLAALEHAGPA